MYIYNIHTYICMYRVKRGDGRSTSLFILTNAILRCIYLQRDHLNISISIINYVCIWGGKEGDTIITNISFVVLFMHMSYIASWYIYIYIYIQKLLLVDISVEVLSNYFLPPFIKCYDVLCFFYYFFPPHIFLCPCANSVYFGR